MSVVCEFRWTVVEFLVHYDIATLHVLGMVHCAVILIVFQGRYHIVHWASQYTNSMEMLAYMPALWMLFQTDQRLLAFEPLSQASTQQQAIWFLVWMMCFNAYEDGISGIAMSGIADP